MTTAKNAGAQLIGWIRDKLAKFLPSIFENKFQKNCEWYTKNGEAKFKEISDAAQKGDYKFPTKDKFYHFNVTFDPGKIKAKEIIDGYINDKNKDLGNLRVELMDAFKDPELAKKLAATKGDGLKTAVENAILYSNIQPEKPIEENHQITVDDWNAINEDMKFMCEKSQDGKCRGGKWSADMEKLSNELQEAIKKLTPTQAEKPAEKPAEQPADNGNAENGGVEQDSYTIKLDKDGVFQEMDGKNDQQNNQQNTENKTDDRNANILKEIQDVANAFYTQSLNTIVTNLFPNIYNDFKGIVDDFDTTKKGGSNGAAQQNNNQQ